MTIHVAIGLAFASISVLAAALVALAVVVARERQLTAVAMASLGWALRRDQLEASATPTRPLCPILHTPGPSTCWETGTIHGVSTGPVAKHGPN
jgi:hypothetical protein